MSLPFVLVTGNANKVREAERIVGHSLDSVAIDLPEIQSLDLVEVLRAKAEEAWARLQRPVVVEETGLQLEGLNGFPGPLIKWLLEAVGSEGLAGLARSLGNPKATAECALLLRDEEGTVLGRGRCEGRLVLPARGGGGFGWDPVFEPSGQSGTCAELGDEIKDRVGHRGRAWRDFLQHLRRHRTGWWR